MRILFLCPYPPYPPHSGGMLRMYHLLRGLARRHTVYCLTFASDPAAVAALAPLRDVCGVVTVPGAPARSLLQRTWTTLTAPQPDMALRNASSRYAATLQRLLVSQPFDVVQAESIEMAHYGLALLQQRSARGQPWLVLDQFNAEYVLQRRAALTDLRQITALRRTLRPLLAGLYSLVQWQKLATYERHLLQAYDHVLAVSTEDRQALHHLAKTASISIIPNGVDTHYFDRSALTVTPMPHLVFTGTMDFRPNIDAVTWFVQQVLPLVRVSHPEVRLVVVGRNPAPAIRALHDGVMVDVTGAVADVRPFIAQAAVYVVPMRIGGGIRLKLLEALAMQTPVVSTSMGAEGLIGTRPLLLADSPSDFAAAVLRLLDDPALRQQLGTDGRRFVQQYYDWEVIVPRLEAVYAALGSNVALHADAGIVRDRWL